MLLPIRVVYESHLGPARQLDGVRHSGHDGIQACVDGLRLAREIYDQSGAADTRDGSGENGSLDALGQRPGCEMMMNTP